ncbi:hypothetical protein, partial [Actinomadura rubrisoli]
MPAEPSATAWRRRDPSPDGTFWATVETPAHPSVREHNPAARRWRDLLVDPDLAGLVPGRARPSAITFEYADGRKPWTLPLPDVLASALAWHPRRPLVAGLAVRDRRAHVWIADLAARTVTPYAGLRAAVSFTGYGAPPVAWCGDDRLALLVPAGRDPEPAVPDGTPIVFEAEGPGHVTFDEPPSELEHLAGAHLAITGLRMGAAPKTITPPLLVRSLEPEQPDGGTLRLSIGRHDEDANGLRWTDVLVNSGI